jgi:hypothetical protein
MKSETITLRLNSEILERIRDLANEETRPIAKQIEHMLKQQLKKEETK